MAEPFPVVYIRGYAMTRSAVEDAFNKPYYGFNLGSTQVRQGPLDKPLMRIFESPVVRLLKEHGYADSFNRFVDAGNRPIPNSVSGAQSSADWRRTLWVFRYYDQESELLGGARKEIEDYAAALAGFLDGIRTACGNPEAFSVNLVAHSMGGLVARCYLQNSRLFERTDLRDHQPVKVNKLFTYATPHRGIAFRKGLGWMEDIRDLVGFAGADSFGEKRMREFLDLGPSVPLHSYTPQPHAPLRGKLMSLIGTDYRDYGLRAARQSVGPGSDGLVAIENAYVQGAPRAFVRRAHSGPFGIVNSEAGYQNLSRFLFGDYCFEIKLAPLTVSRQLPGLAHNDLLDYLLMDTGVVIRGLAAEVQKRTADTHSAIIVGMKAVPGGGYVSSQDTGIHLYTGYLSTAGKMPGARYLRAALDLRIEPHYRHEGWIRDSRFEGEVFFSARLYFGVRAVRNKMDIQYRWGHALLSRTTKPAADGFCTIPLPATVNRYLESDGVRLRVSPWS